MIRENTWSFDFDINWSILDNPFESKKQKIIICIISDILNFYRGKCTKIICFSKRLYISQCKVRTSNTVQAHMKLVYFMLNIMPPSSFFSCLLQIWIWFLFNYYYFQVKKWYMVDVYHINYQEHTSLTMHGHQSFFP